MTREEILERSRNELQGETVSEECVRIRKEKQQLNETGVQHESFRWAAAGQALAIIILALYRLRRGQEVHDLVLVLFGGMAGLYTARTVLTRKKLDAFIAAFSILVFIDNLVPFIRSW
jgi:hypothetical protein